MYSHIANMKYNKSLELMMSSKRIPGMSKEKVAAVGEMKGELDLTPPEIIVNFFSRKNSPRSRDFLNGHK